MTLNYTINILKMFNLTYRIVCIVGTWVHCHTMFVYKCFLHSLLTVCYLLVTYIQIL